MFENIFNRRSKRDKHRRPETARKLKCESLEIRRMHAVNVFRVNGLLQIRGDSGSDIVDVRQNDSTNQLTVSVNGRQVGSYSSHGIDRIDASLGAGNDTLNFRLLSNLTQDKEIRIDLGSGNDAANLYGNAHQIRNDLVWTVVGGTGSDNAWTDLGGLNDNVTALFSFDMGSGDDRVPFFMRGELELGAEVIINALAGDDNDALAFDTVRNGGLDIDSTARLWLNLDGGNGIDQVGFYYSGDLDGALDASLNGGNGYDYLRFYSNLDSDSEGRFNVQHSGMQEWRPSGYY